jgi:hypothetical protein
VAGAAAMADGSISEGTFMERERGGDLDGCRVATAVLIEDSAGSFILLPGIINASERLIVRRHRDDLALETRSWIQR